MAYPIYPFRWNISKRSQLGALLRSAELLGRDENDPFRIGLLRYCRLGAAADEITAFNWLKSTLLSCSARIIGLAGDSDLVFVGRSPESIFDLLSGLLFDTSWQKRLSLLHFSTGCLNDREIARHYAAKIPELRHYLTHLQLDPFSLAKRERPVALVDIVATGETLGYLVGILYGWRKELDVDWHAVRRKIRIVGLTEQKTPSPGAYRWFQNVRWLRLLAPGNVKNVSIPSDFYDYLGVGQPKLAISYAPHRWGDAEVLTPRYDRYTLAALRMAVSLFDAGQERQKRLAFARELCIQPAMQFRWLRDLVLELKS